jgi:hypothetical protein
MYRVKSFGTELKPFHTMNELRGLDEKVNAFLAEEDVKRVVSVSDAPTTGDQGEIIGLVRVVCCEY